MKVVATGAYDNHTADMIRNVKELSREELKKLLDSRGEDVNLGSNGTGDVSDTTLG